MDLLIGHSFVNNPKVKIKKIKKQKKNQNSNAICNFIPTCDDEISKCIALSHPKFMPTHGTCSGEYHFFNNNGMVAFVLT